MYTFVQLDQGSVKRLGSVTIIYFFLNKRWWFKIFFLIFAPKIWEDDTTLTHIFEQDGYGEKPTN